MMFGSKKDETKLKSQEEQDEEIRTRVTERMALKKRRNRYAYYIISFNQGLGSISELAVSYFFKDQLMLEPAKLSQIMSIIAIPWMIKPLFGLITDLLPICGYRRKMYLIACGLMNIVCWLMMCLFAQTLWEASMLLLLINIGLSFSTVLGEAVVVELSQLERNTNGNEADAAKDYVSLFFFCKYVGALLSAYLKGLLVEVLNVRSVFFVASFLPWLLVISGIILIENKVGEKEETEVERMEEQYGTITHSNNPQPEPSGKELITEFFAFLCQKYVIVPTIFIIIFMATPSYGDPFFYFLTNELKFTPSDLGKISFCSTFATLMAILLYKWYFKNCDFKLMITVGTIVSFFFSFLGYLLVMRINVKFGISDFILVLFSNSFLSMLGELILMPMLALACLLCPKNLEGTVYSLFMSSLNFGGILSGLNGSILTSYLGITAKDYHNLHTLILISNMLTLLPLPILLFISSSYFHPEKKEETTQSETSHNEGETEKLIVSEGNNNNSPANTLMTRSTQESNDKINNKSCDT